MKKIPFFTAFLAIFLIFFPFANTQAYADEEFVDAMSITVINYSELDSKSSFQTGSGPFIFSFEDENGFDYADIETTITLTPNISYIDSEDSYSLNYRWESQATTDTAVTANLTLSKSEAGIQALNIGTSVYTFTVSDSYSGKSASATITLSISGSTSPSASIQTSASTYGVTYQTEAFELNINIPISEVYTSKWYLKVPNVTSYKQVETTNNTFTFNPADYINANNGYGEYKIFTISTSSNGSIYYSETLSIYGSPVPLLSGDEAYEILSKKTPNFRYAIEAFIYSISAQETLDPNNVYWYINNNRVCSGFSLTYEPTSTETYRVTANYNNNGNIISLATTTQTPKSTGTNMLLLYIGISVVVLGGILAISIIHTNRKRDVVW